MMYQLLLFSVFTFMPIEQATSEKDSLFAIIRTGLIESKIDAYITLTDYYAYNRSDSALWASQQAVILAHQSNDFKKLAESYRVLSIYLGDVGLYDRAIESTYTSIAYRDSLGGPNRQRDIAGAYHNLAWYFAHMEDFEKPLALFHAALKFYPLENTDDSIQHAVSFHALGSYYYLYDTVYDSAVYYLNKTINWRKKLPISDEVQAQGIVELSHALLLTNEINEGTKVLDELRANDIDTYSLYVQNYVIFLDGLSLHQQGKYNLALPYIEQVYHWGDSSQLLYSSTGINLMRQLIETASMAEQYDRAYNYLSRLRNIEQESIYKDRQRTTKALEFVHETGRKEQQIIAQSNQLGLQRQILWVSVIGLLMVSSMLFWVYRIYQRVNEKNQKIEMLMRELHHRVKNNLQVISSLLGLQSMKMEEGEAKLAVEEGKSRVRAMAMIHQKLYKKDDLIGVDFNDYVSDLVNELKNTYYPNRDIEIMLNIPSQSLDVDTTLPLGLMINEMVSNAFKYAFIDIEEPLLKIELLTIENDMKLIVSDNGKGIDSEFELDAANSFGMKLIRMLTKQLEGEMKMINKGGLKYELNFSNN